MPSFEPTEVLSCDLASDGTYGVTTPSTTTTSTTGSGGLVDSILIDFEYEVGYDEGSHEKVILQSIEDAIGKWMIGVTVEDCETRSHSNMSTRRLSVSQKRRVGEAMGMMEGRDLIVGLSSTPVDAFVDGTYLYVRFFHFDFFFYSFFFILGNNISS